MARWIVLAAWVAFGAGCGADHVAVELNFPSQETFFNSDFARVRVFDLAPDALGDCPSLVASAIAGTGERAPSQDSNNVDVCDAYDGIVFDEIGEGPKAFVVTASASNTVILAGCTVGEVYPDAPTIVVHLAMTSAYTSASTPSSCTSIADKCERGCP